MLVGFAEEDDGRIIINKLYTADTIFIPNALIQFKLNLACTPASYIETFNNVDPGSVLISERTFDFPDEVLESTYYLTEEQIGQIKKHLPESPTYGTDAYGIDECLIRCKNYESKPYESQGKYETNKIKQMS